MSAMWYVDPQKLKWVWLTHDDADHTGSIRRVMELAPNARLVTNAFSAADGDLVAGPDGAGACDPVRRRAPRRRPHPHRRRGMLGWATSDSPWAHVTDREQFSQVLDRVRQLQPTRIFVTAGPKGAHAADVRLLEQ